MRATGNLRIAQLVNQLAVPASERKTSAVRDAMEKASSSIGSYDAAVAFIVTHIEQASTSTDEAYFEKLDGLLLDLFKVEEQLLVEQKHLQELFRAQVVDTRDTSASRGCEPTKAPQAPAEGASAPPVAAVQLFEVFPSATEAGQDLALSFEPHESEQGNRSQTPVRDSYPVLDLRSPDVNGMRPMHLAALPQVREDADDFFPEPERRPSGTLEVLELDYEKRSDDDDEPVYDGILP
jgi:hypothetical protein